MISVTIAALADLGHRIHVADDGHADDRREAAADGLNEAQPLHLVDRVRKGDRDRGQGKDAEADQADSLTADLVGERAAEELADAVADQVDADRVVELHDAHAERLGHGRHGRQIGVEAQRADRHERAHEQYQMARRRERGRGRRRSGSGGSRRGHVDPSRRWAPRGAYISRRPRR
jgi:hypothetical protein